MLDLSLVAWFFKDRVIRHVWRNVAEPSPFWSAQTLKSAHSQSRLRLRRELNQSAVCAKLFEQEIQIVIKFILKFKLYTRHSNVVVVFSYLL